MNRQTCVNITLNLQKHHAVIDAVLLYVNEVHGIHTGKVLYRSYNANGILLPMQCLEHEIY